MDATTIHILLYILAGAIVAINANVCFLVMRFRFLRTHTNGFVVSLAISDLLTGAVMFPVILQRVYTVQGYVVAFILVAGVANICAVTLDRYIAITRPLRHRLLMPRLFSKVIAANWLGPLIITLIPLFWENNTSTFNHYAYLWFLLVISAILPYTLIVVAYLRILREVRRSHDKHTVSSTNRRRMRRLRREAGAARIFAIVSFTFMVSWLPIIYITIVANIMGKYHLVPPSLNVISYFTISLGSLVNPLIYTFAKPDFSAALRKMMCGRRERLLAGLLWLQNERRVVVQLYRRHTSFSLFRSHNRSSTTEENNIENLPVAGM